MDLPVRPSAHDGSAPTAEPSARILIVKLSALGDVIHTLPALTTLRRHQPSAELHWLVEDAAADLLDSHPALDARLVLPRREWRQLRQEGRWLEAARRMLRFRSELRSVRYDWALDFQGLAKSAIWIASARARRKAGFGPGLPRNEGAWLALNTRVPPPSADVHALDRNLLLLEALGFPRLPLQYDIPSSPEREARARTLLQDAGVNPLQPWIAINPVTRWPTKDWHADGWAAVVRALDTLGIGYVFTGGPADAPSISAVESLLGHPLPRLDGRTRLPELADVLRSSRVLVTTDTGPMHLAAAVGTPVVALFGPTAPWRTGPYGKGHHVLREALECSPCFRRRCTTTRYERLACMRRITPDRVIAAIRSVVG